MKNKEIRDYFVMLGVTQEEVAQQIPRKVPLAGKPPHITKRQLRNRLDGELEQYEIAELYSAADKAKKAKNEKMASKN